MELSTWLESVATRLEITDVPLTDEMVQLVLDLARDSAHEVQRVAAPLTTFLAGVAVGRGVPLGTATRAITDLLALPGPETQEAPG